MGNNPSNEDPVQVIWQSRRIFLKKNSGGIGLRHSTPLTLEARRFRFFLLIAYCPEPEVQVVANVLTRLEEQLRLFELRGCTPLEGP